MNLRIVQTVTEGKAFLGIKPVTKELEIPKVEWFEFSSEKRELNAMVANEENNLTMKFFNDVIYFENYI